jgi:chitinase
LSFDAGETSKTITVDVDDDDLQEGNETFRLVLSNPTDATISTGTNTVTITDNDASSIAFTTNAVTLAETNVSVTLTIIRSGATNTAVAINFTTTNVTASAGSDYSATNGTFAFAPGETTNTLTIALADDLLYEANETFRVILSGITNSSLGTGTNTITITDDDAAYLGFIAATDGVNELDGSIDLIVTRSGVTNTTVSVAYSTTNISATAGTDYTATNGVLSFAPGETNKTITIAIAFDADIEANETFRVRLVNFTNAAPAANSNLTVTITDAFGDPPFSAIVSISSYKAVGDGEFLLRVTGPNGVRVVIESTTNFTTWTPVHSAVISGGGFDWIAPMDTAAPARFFRAVPPR